MSAAFLLRTRGNWNDTPTGIDLSKLPHFRLAKLGSGPLQNGASVKFDSITADRRFDEIQLGGLAKSGKRWEAHLCSSCMVDIWRADLDANGTQDYVFFGGGPYFNGRMTPLYSMTILLMDSQGLPVPFFTVMYHGENGEAVQHLLDLDHGGRPELLISTYDEAVSDPRVGAFCSGHWIHQLYRFRNLGAEEVRGTMGGIKFPLVHGWTYHGTECQEAEQPFLLVQAPILVEQGTSTARELSTSILGIRDEQLLVDPVGGCNTIRPGVVVYDRKEVREIAFENLMSEYKFGLTEAIRTAHARVKLRGLGHPRGGADCSVNLMWAAP